MKKILVLCPIGIGNYLLLYPSIYALKQKFPQAEIHLLSLRKSIYSFAIKDKIFTSIIDADPVQNKNLINKIRLILKIRALNCDTAISFFPTNRFEYNALMFLSKAKLRYAFEYNLKFYTSGSFFANKHIKVKDGLHDVYQNLSLLNLLDISAPQKLTFPELYNKEDLNFAENWIKNHNLENKKIIGIHAGSSADHGMINKRWPENNFAALSKKLLNDNEYYILVFGGEEESDIKRTIVNLIGKKAILVEKMSITNTSALISKSTYFISNDSALMHFAALSNVPTVGIFGPTDDIRTAPFGKNNLVIRNADYKCSPCWNIGNVGTRTDCSYKNYPCLNNLSVDEVYKKIKLWLGNK